jgi:hypothetical protein
MVAMTNKTDEQMFAEGFIAGWRSIPNVSPPVPPSIPDYKVRSGKPPYEQGYEEGRAVAGGK